MYNAFLIFGLAVTALYMAVKIDNLVTTNKCLKLNVAITDKYMRLTGEFRTVAGNVECLSKRGNWYVLKRGLRS